MPHSLTKVNQKWLCPAMLLIKEVEQHKLVYAGNHANAI